MQFSIRLHDAVDPETVLGRVLPVIAGARGERRVAYARFAPDTGALTRRWSTAEGGAVESADIEVEQLRLVALCVGLLVDQAGLRAGEFEEPALG